MKTFINIFVVFCLLGLCNQAVFAATGKARVTITHLDSELIDGVYYMNTDLELVLSKEMLEALQRGVPLVYLLTVRVLKPRFGGFSTQNIDKHVYSVEERYELRYHALSRQYLVTDLRNTKQTSFYTLRSALEYLGTIRDLPLLKKSIMDIDKRLYAQVKVKLDIERLPVPLKVRAYVKKSWRVKTRWKNWLP